MQAQPLPLRAPSRHHLSRFFSRFLSRPLSQNLDPSYLHRPLRRQIWLLATALALALLVWVGQPQSVFAQTDCPGGRVQKADRNGDGIIDPGPTETFTLEGCRKIDFTLDGGTKTARVYFTTANGIATDRLMAVDGDGNGSAEISAVAIADEIVRWTRDAWVIYRNYGFNHPMGRSDMNVHVFDMRPGLGGWCCSSDNFEIDTLNVLPGFRFGGDRRGPESIVYHEMWHASEWSPAFGCWTIEATASAMTDHVNPALDIYPSNDFIGRVRGYLNGGMETSLLNHCYTGALWWKYYMQETGTIVNDLDQGVNSMHDFWFDSAATDMARMDNVIRSRGGGRTFESLWIDFAVANYAKEYAGPVVTSHYRYLDEQESSAPDYPAPRLTSNFNLTTGTGIPTVQTDIAAWASQYYQFTINPAVPFIDLEVRQDANKRLGYVLLLQRNNDIVQEIRYVGRDFVQNFANAGYTRMVLIVVGLNDFANYRFDVNSTTPTLNILDPLNGRKALAGRIDAPDKILVKVEVLSPSGGAPIPGIDPNTFSVTVGSRVVQPADRISAAYVQGQYWLLLRAPTQSVAGDYDLRVQYSTLSDTETTAVRYQNRNDFDNVLVIDRSGSMSDFPGNQPMESAKDAARLYVDSWRTGDGIGVVSFNDVAQDPAPLTLRPWDSTSRSDALTAINGLVPFGGTCIGCGVQKGLDELVARGLPAHSWALIVLSDGKENVGAIANFITSYNTRRNAGQQVPVVHTVALGPDADRARLEKLAADTGGTFSFAAIPAGASTASVHAESLSNNLGEIYRVIGEEVAGQEQIYSVPVDVEGDTLYTQTVTVDGAASEAIFVLKSAIGITGVVALLQDPNGIQYPNPDLVDSHHKIWRIASPTPGEWKIVLYIPIIGAASVNAIDEILVEAAVDSELTMDVFLGLAVEERLVGTPMPILVSLADSAPIPGATMLASVFAPNGGIYGVALYDDGAHDDGGASDGFYGGVFNQTQTWGSYDLVVTASGTVDSGAFVRRYRTSFSMLDTRVLDQDPEIDPNLDPTNPTNPDPNNTDSDDDGIPDPWEETHGLDPTVNDANEDPDHDGLTNGEEYDHGTDPLQSDTDHGGQNDGSEVHTLPTPLDPLNPADDQVLCPAYFEAEPVYHDRDEHVDANAVILYYDVAAEHSTVTIYRALDEAGPLTTLISDTVATGIYSDTTAALNTPYFYWLTAFDAEGHASCILGPADVTRTEDPIEPEAVILINNGALATNNVNVALNINASADTTEMQVSNDPNFNEESGWQPYQTDLPWVLEPEEEVGTVYAIFRDEAGNVSEVEFDAIQFPGGIAFDNSIYMPALGKE